jgi:hypothetical protein
MRFLQLLAYDFSKFAAFLGKWLFLVSTPVVLLVATSYHHAGRSILEPILGLAFVTVIFAVTHLISVKLDRSRSVGFGFGPQGRQLQAELPTNKTEQWNQHDEQEIRQLEMARVATLKLRQREADLWRLANPWGGYNPYE